MTFLRKITLTNFFVALLFLADRITKNFAFGLPEGGFFLFSKKFIGLQLFKNYHLIFNLKLNQYLLYLFIFLILSCVLLFLIKNYEEKNYFLVFCFSLITIGAISNLLDRLLYGYVVDFLSFFDYSIFNLADVYIFVGAGLILIKIFKSDVSFPRRRESTLRKK
ncbi:hypothetical protein A2316_04305 [Candidatus Falkowbacteria bacterium RIFOXYB2_FULL_38_15]|uniref:Lipoprotein signal peptidase n=1 Tax=Candidatus Falkowbacteria bacterium RIFOXYA2_FULL_38_12 TaxID=1797993 RepID=A0A1F5S4C9_9BACT|nr:MAG: hypothetical protein A2257_01225 [Candidatus Falkowbacteria bacterium RIFOXYA2_FULL_38_12]OGF33715.1 MAG: hypothetical protein A2316_04305 [Candidatus Falkowbacteria bacterium RIFOXYB2_FULL_38_15]OGF42288.1 MAG: hypothetical protein A2555_04335 [Candidatus Falkowbacteria bacterium RIFOXYD2_FULL_39_16]